MARDVESLVLQMSADLRRFDKSMAGMRASADRRLNEVEKRALQADRQLSQTMGSAGRNMVSSLKANLSGLAPVLAGAFSTAAVLNYADAYTALQNRLKAAGLEGAALKRVEDSLYESANRNGVAVAATAELYQRAAMARNNLGASEEQLLALVSGTSAALKLQGTSATEASGALLQLGQILSGEKVQAQEYNSLIDQLPVLLQAAADGSGRFGGEISVLTQQVKAGKVTTQEFFAALLKGLGEVETRAATATPTVGAAFQTLNNEIGRFVGQTDEGLSATQRMAQGIVALADNLDTVAFVIGAVATIMGGRYLLALTAAASGSVVATAASLRYQLALAALAARQGQVVTANVLATASTGALSTATVVSTAATRAFTAALVANPLGAVLVAVTALAAGVYFLSQRYGEANILQRALDKSAADTTAAMSAYEDAARAAATATGENAKAATANVSAMRAEAITALQSAQALRVRTAALAASRAAEARKESDDIRTSMGPGQTTLNQGQAAAAQARAERAATQAAEAAREAMAAQTELARINANIRDGAYRPTTRSSSGPSGAGDAGTPDGDQIARAREALAIEEDIARARASGNEAAINAAEERQRLAQLTAQYEGAGYADANARAIEQLSLLNAAEALVEDRAKAEKEVDLILAGRERQIEREAEYAQLLNDQLMDRLGFERELAGLVGEEGAIGAAERRLWVEERTNEILRLRLALTEGEARAMAGVEFGALEAAGQTGEMREAFRRSFSEGLRAAIDGDLGGFFEGLADRFTDRMLDNLADDLFDLVSQAAKGFGGAEGQGGGWISAIASLFSGRARATGGPVTAGQAYVVGERRPEVFVPSTAGSIIPSVNRAMSQAGRSSGRQVVEYRLTVSPETDSFIRLASDAAAPMAVQAAATAYGASRSDMASAQRRARQRFV